MFNDHALFTTCDIINLMSPHILDKDLVEQLDRSICTTVYFDIYGILSSKLKNVISFGAKMVVKWPIIPIIDEGPISWLCP